jgi:hypothetical protein
MSHNDEGPNEEAPHIDPTQLAKPYGFTNPYMQSPYEYSSDIPPPPPRRRKGFLWLFSAIILVLLLLSLTFIIYTFYGNTSHHATTGKQTTTQPDTKSTPNIETPTLAAQSPLPTRSVPYYANDIYNEFVANGLGGSDPKQDRQWSCCTYVPAGGAVYWTDSQSPGHSLDIATFYDNPDAETDALDLMNKGFGTNVVRACLLSYDTDVPANVISLYLQVMQQYCV